MTENDMRMDGWWWDEMRWCISFFSSFKIESNPQSSHCVIWFLHCAPCQKYFMRVHLHLHTINWKKDAPKGYTLLRWESVRTTASRKGVITSSHTAREFEVNIMLKNCEARSNGTRREVDLLTLNLSSIVSSLRHDGIITDVRREGYQKSGARHVNYYPPLLEILTPFFLSTFK